MDNLRREPAERADLDRPELLETQNENSSDEARSTLASISRGDLTFRLANLPADLQTQESMVALDETARSLRHVVGRLVRAAQAVDSVVSDVLSGIRALSSSVLTESERIDRCSELVTRISFTSQSVEESINALRSEEHTS